MNVMDFCSFCDDVPKKPAYICKSCGHCVGAIHACGHAPHCKEAGDAVEDEEASELHAPLRE